MLTTARGATSRRWWPVLACLCCVAGFGLRIRGLGSQSLWLDEGATSYFASMSRAGILAATFHSEPNPPLYYLLVHYWMAGAGSSEFALRFPSVVAGVLTIALVYRLGRDLFGPVAAVGGAALVSVSAYLIWYSQEARAYSVLGCAGIATLLLLARACRQPSPFRWAAFGVLLTLTLYSHFYGVFVLPAVTLLLLVNVRQEPMRRAWRSWLVATGVATLVYLPWLVAMLHAGAAGTNWRAPAGLGAIAWNSALAFADDGALPAKQELVLVGAELVLAALGVIGAAVTPNPSPPSRGTEGDGSRAWLLPAGLVLPTLAIALLSRVSPIFAPSYVIAQAPLFYLAAAAGLAFGCRRIPWLALPCLAALVAASLLAASDVQHDPRFRKEDFRTAAQYLDGRARSRDVVVLVANYASLPFDYYYRGPGDVAPFEATPDQAGPALSPLLVGKDVAWLLLSHAEQVDPRGQVHAWLDGHYPLVTEAFPRGIQLYGYRVDYLRADVPAGVTPLHLRYGTDVQLVGYQAVDNIPARDNLLHPPSNWLHVVLYWQALAAITTSYRSSVQMVDGRGVWGQELVRSSDALSFAATRHWQPGQIAVEDVDVNLNPATPPGRYQLDVRLLSASGQPLPLSGGAAAVGMVAIAGP